jgi:serine/threonine protein kinase
MSLSPGDRVDRYEVLELLGSGGMGEVYRARDSKLARLVALKILRVGVGQGTDGAARLLREARAAASLSHANVVAVFDVGEVQEPEALRGLPYIAMELVVGRSLRSYVGDTTVPMTRRIGWLRDVALALGAAHETGIVHRDVKPENVMIRSDGVVKVLDFGIARRVMTPIDRMASTGGQSVPKDGAPIELALGTLTEEGQVIGTPYYMAPEQLRAEPLDGRTDQFAWGVVAYELLTGAAPWRKDVTALATVSEILSVTPSAPVEVDANIPRGWSEAIERVLSKQRGARFATMEALVASAESGGESESKRETGARSVPTDRVPTEKVRAIEPTGHPRRVVARWLFGAAALVASLGIVVLLVRSARRGTAAPVTRLDARGEEACMSNAACSRMHAGAAWRCHSRRHECVEIASRDCTVYAEASDLEAEDVVWIGGMFPLSTDPSTLSESRAVDLARQDFVSALGSSGARLGPLHARPIGTVICDEGVDALRAARHLTEDVEVPAVIGFRSMQRALATIPTVFLPAHALSFVSISQASEITRIPEPGDEPRLVWRSTLDRLDSATALAHFISEALEPMIRAQPNGIANRPLRVAAVWPREASSGNFVEALFDALHYNGRSALENNANFRQFVFDREPGAGGNDVVGELLAFAPQVVVFAEDSFFPRVLAPLEAQWQKGRGPRPVYLTTSGLGRPEFDFAGRDLARRKRFFAVSNLCTTPTNAKLVLRYNRAFPSQQVVRGEAPQPSYDAFYTLAYATYALGEAPITGPALSRAIERLLPPGPKIDVGPGQIFEGFEALRSRGQIDLNGAIGSLDFDPTTGEAPIDYSIVCIGVDDTGKASEGIDSGLVYDARAKRLVGALRCP